MNLKPSAGQVCSAPLTLPNALHQLFSIPTYATSSPQQPPAVQPSREQPPQFVQPQPIAQPIPQVPVQVAILKQPVQPIAQPIPQPMKPAVQVPVQPKAVQPSVQPKIVQPSAQIATAPAQQPPMEPREEEIPELPYETFILTLKRLNGIFKEEIVGSLSRYHDELNKVMWPPRTGDLDESFEELRKMALHLSQLLEEDTETESTVLRPLDEHQSKVYEDINANVTTKNMPG
ncbi:hypothetical protein B566_EDAN009995 [Ephemera danica]|nr:hypothetical protein B566_EDAN009995 [Ephemera danica]